MQVTRLLFIASVDEAHRLVCQAPGCNRAITNIYVIQDETGSLRVVGSGCFQRLAGNDRATQLGEAFIGFKGRRLSPDERAELVANTEAFIARIEAQQAAKAAAAELQAKQQQQAEAEEAERRRQQAEAQRSSQLQLQQPQGGYAPRRGEYVSPQRKLALFREQEARRAARDAVESHPELAAYPLQTVVEAIRQGKERYKAKGGDMNDSGARRAIAFEARQLLIGPSEGGSQLPDF